MKKKKTPQKRDPRMPRADVRPAPGVPTAHELLEAVKLAAGRDPEAPPPPRQPSQDAPIVDWDAVEALFSIGATVPEVAAMLKVEETKLRGYAGGDEAAFKAAVAAGHQKANVSLRRILFMFARGRLVDVDPKTREVMTIPVPQGLQLSAVMWLASRKQYLGLSPAEPEVKPAEETLIPQGPRVLRIVVRNDGPAPMLALPPPKSG